MKKLLALILVFIFTVGLITPIEITNVYASNGVVMTVNGKEYTDHGTGWSAAVKLANGGTDVTVKLFADWVADSSTGFVCPDGGTKDGALYIESCKITVDLNGYTINRNAPGDAINARVFYVYRGTFTLNDSSEAQTGVITGGRSSENGGAVYVHNSEFVMNGGTIKGNYAGGYGGAVSVEDIRVPWVSYFTMNGGVIEENYAVKGGGALNISAHCYFTMNGGIIRNNRAYGNGGAVFGSDGVGTEKGANIKIMGGSFIGNVSEDGHGGAIYFQQYNPLIVINCTMTGNSAPRGSGGAIFTAQTVTSYHSAYMFFGGKVNITGNTAHTDRADKTSNVAVTSYIGQATGMTIYGVEIPDVPLSKDSRIGLSYGMIHSSMSKTINHVENGRITEEVAFCFTSDELYYSIGVEYREDGFVNLSFENVPRPAGMAAMRVETSEGIKNFYEFGKGWVYAIQQSKIQDVKLTLLADWIGCGYFYYCDDEGIICGTRFIEGDLYISPDTKYNITIDLNGHTISRDAKDLNDVGDVFYIDTDATVTFMDSSEANTGKITGAYNTEDGGAFYVNNGVLRLDGVEVSGNKAKCGAGVYATNYNDSFVYVLPGTRICNNTATEDGGGIYMYNGFLYVEGGEISGNTAVDGAGVYWASRNAGCFTGGRVSGNNATGNGSGVYVTDWGNVYLGGNTEANLYLSSSSANISNACGQGDAPNKPLTDGAYIGITSVEINDVLSDSNSKFNEGDFEYFHSDDSSRYYIRSVYNPDGGNHAHKLYINEWAHKDARYPRVKSVSVKNSELIESAELDYNTQTITITARNTKKNYFERASLYNLIECTYDKDIYSIYGMANMRDLRDVQKYKIMSDNGTYVLCTVKLVPSGGAWAPQQEEVADSCAMTVTHGTTTKKFDNADEGWAYAVSQTGPVTVALFEHWVATGGNFTGSGTEDGYLYMDDEDLDITIDLNGYTVDRGLNSAIPDGQVFKIDDGKLTITDSIGTGKITGGNTTGKGGAFWVEYGTLRIKGGEISGNKAEYGGAVYCDDLDDAFIYIEDGKFVGNKATEDGGAIYIFNGYLDISGGEISGNTAKNGAGIYWESDNSAFLTGGKIINNNATVSGGVYVETNGNVYVGGDVTITGNGNGNLYLYNGACISNARGQATDVPNKPLSAVARIGISASKKERIISKDKSKFGEADFDVIFSDNSGYFIRSAYNAADEGHEYKLYINSWGNEDSRYPRVKTVSVKNSDIIEDAMIDYDEQIITLKVSADNKDALKSVALANLISYTCDKDIYYIDGADKNRDLTTVQKYKTISDNGTYVMVIVDVEWICSEHTDADNDGVCDDCREYVFSNTTIVNYNAQTQESSVFVTEAGRYYLMFADYEDGSLENVDVVEYDFNEGINVVPQKIAGIKLASGDKIMLWYNLTDCVPVCNNLALN